MTFEGAIAPLTAVYTIAIARLKTSVELVGPPIEPLLCALKRMHRARTQRVQYDLSHGGTTARVTSSRVAPPSKALCTRTELSDKGTMVGVVLVHRA